MDMKHVSLSSVHFCMSHLNECQIQGKNELYCIDFGKGLNHRLFGFRRILYLNPLFPEELFGITVFISDLNQARLAANPLYFESESLGVLF